MKARSIHQLDLNHSDPFGIAGRRAAVPRDGSVASGPGEAPAIIAGPSSSARANIPIGTKSVSSLPHAGTTGSADAVGPPVTHAALRQLKSKLAFSP